MRRFFVDKIEKPRLRLTGEEYKHLAEVLRARVGDRVVLCPNDGRDYVYEAVAFDRSSVTLEYIEEMPNPTEPELRLTVYAALLKGDKTEYAVQKLTELGAAKFVPFVSEFTVKRSEKTDRLVRTAHEASKQCGRARLPEVGDVLTFEEMMSTLSGYDAVIFAYEGAYAAGKRLDEVLTGNERSVALIVGPEGGFSEGEVNVLKSAGYEPVTLGKRILRAETAAVAAAAVIMYAEGEWR